MFNTIKSAYKAATCPTELKRTLTINKQNAEDHRAAGEIFEYDGYDLETYDKFMR